MTSMVSSITNVNPSQFTCEESRDLLRSVLTSDDASADVSTYQTILELVTADDLDSALLSAKAKTGLVEDHEFVLLSGVVEIIDAHPLIKELPREQYTKILKLLETLLKSVHDVAVEVAVKRHNDEIENDADLDSRSKPVILTKLRRNAYIIDAKTRIPVDVIEPPSDKKRRAILVLRYTDNGVYRYEPVGILQENNSHPARIRND